MLWFTSDLHFGHDKEFLYKSRGFNSITEMNEAIIKNWNNVVAPDDTVYILGDLMLGDNENGLACLERLNGWLYIICGNHDTLTRECLYVHRIYHAISVVYAAVVKWQGCHFYLSHYPTFCRPLEKRGLKKGPINLFGHTHQKTPFFVLPGTEEEVPFMYNVGLDAHGLTPVSADIIIRDIKEKMNEYRKEEQTETGKTAETEKEKKKEKENNFKTLIAESDVLEIYGELVASGILPEKQEKENIKDILLALPDKVTERYKEKYPKEMRELGHAAERMITRQSMAIVKKHLGF